MTKLKKSLSVYWSKGDVQSSGKWIPVIRACFCEISAHFGRVQPVVWSLFPFLNLISVSANTGSLSSVFESITSGSQKSNFLPSWAKIFSACINCLITSIWNWAAASCSYWVWLSLEHWQKPTDPAVETLSHCPHHNRNRLLLTTSDLRFLLNFLPQHLSFF